MELPTSRAGVCTGVSETAPPVALTLVPDADALALPLTVSPVADLIRPVNSVCIPTGGGGCDELLRVRERDVVISCGELVPPVLPRFESVRRKAGNP